jgi:hypothetical protein
VFSWLASALGTCDSGQLNASVEKKVVQFALGTQQASLSASEQTVPAHINPGAKLIVFSGRHDVMRAHNCLGAQQ